SGTRREELLIEDVTLQKVWTMRRMIDALGGGMDALQPLLERLSRTRTNDEFLSTLHLSM
ncbi:MAG: transcription termination factor Rho, partial [Anaerolineae bacterium]|nr:transcription termination factor Rho [Anaerolineae bacterium]MCB0239284.1 transcription termination factor Rho [Anaerolineae bacterium]MCB0242084.1 transcription termination factor Rho [Anaerolineae bacterium]